MRRILDAREVHGVRTAIEYVHRHEAIMAMAGRAVWRSVEPLIMTIQHGRYFARCPHCSKPLSGSREWSVALCFTCAAAFTSSIIWPAVGIERELCKRPVDPMSELPIFSNWEPHETLEQLQREAFEHGVR